MSKTYTIKHLCTMLGKQPLALLGILFSAIIAVGCNVYAPIVIGNAIDHIQRTFDIQQVKRYLLLLAILYVCYALSSWMMMYISNRTAITCSNTLRKTLHEKLSHLPIAFFDNHDHGDLISRFINDIDNISDGLLQGLSTCISGLCTIIAAIFCMFQISWQMSMIVMLSSPFTYLIAKAITTRSQTYFHHQANDLGTLQGFSEELLGEIKTVKAYQYEEQAFVKFRNMNEALYHSGVKSQFFGSLANPGTRFIMNTVYTLVGISGAFLRYLHIISIGNISTFLMYASIYSKPFNEITGIMTQLQSALASGQRIFQLFDEIEEKEPTAQTYHWKGEIQFHHVSFSYDANTPLMQDVSLYAASGSTVAIVGHTGAGKTTLVNLLMRFYDNQKGQICIDGVNISHINRNALRIHIGMVLQDTYLFEGSIADNIAYGKQAATLDEIVHVAKQSGAHAFIQHLPQGYDTYLKNGNNILSQGERQLLSITRVILKDPAILLLDEATSNIDTLSEQRVSKAMETMMKGRTSFIIAHRLSTILHADLILVMKHGNIVEQGTHTQLLKQQGTYAALYESQFS